MAVIRATDCSMAGIAEVVLADGIVTTIDAGDVHLVAPYSWRLWNRPPHKYATSCINHKSVGMHRIIMNAGAGQMVDHIDGNGLNNCRSNLRIVNRRQNRANSIKRSAASSAFKGVYKCGDRWRAQIAAKELPVTPWYIGSFDTEHDAAVAYDAFARLLFGDHARINFPQMTASQ